MTKRTVLDQILGNPSLSDAQKIDQLKRLKYDLERLAVATEENMPDLRPEDEKSPDLRQVVLALEALGYTNDPSDAK
jgi:hypothetical protein